MPVTSAVFEAVSLLAGTLAADLAPREWRRRTLETAVAVIAAEGGSILVHEPEQRRLRFDEVVGELEARLKGTTMEDGRGVAGHVAHTGQPCLHNDAPSAQVHFPMIDALFNFRTRNLATVPLRGPQGQAIGVFQLVNKREGDFTPDDLLALEALAAIAAASVEASDLSGVDSEAPSPEG
jgi:GAF domain-containing protein